jgi:hypothetical protein
MFMAAFPFLGMAIVYPVFVATFGKVNAVWPSLSFARFLLALPWEATEAIFSWGLVVNGLIAFSLCGVMSRVAGRRPNPVRPAKVWMLFTALFLLWYVPAVLWTLPAFIQPEAVYQLRYGNRYPETKQLSPEAVMIDNGPRDATNRYLIRFGLLENRVKLQTQIESEWHHGKDLWSVGLVVRFAGAGPDERYLGRVAQQLIDAKGKVHCKAEVEVRVKDMQPFRADDRLLKTCSYFPRLVAFPAQIHFSVMDLVAGVVVEPVLLTRGWK